MTPEEQRIAIAEVCGVADRFVLVKRGLYYRPNANGYTAFHADAWVVSEEEANRHVYPHDEPVTKQRAPLPDYHNDLNAMHEAEKTLTDKQLMDYVGNLNKTTPLGSWMIVATAAQRAEAFLKTLGRWKDK